MFNSRYIAKFVKDQLVWSAATAATATAIHTVVDEPTETQENVINGTSLFVGHLVMRKLSDVTDRPIDAIADWRHNRKVAKTITES